MRSSIILAYALSVFASAQIAVAAPSVSISISGLPSGGAIYGQTYNVTVNFTYTWDSYYDRPDGGGSVQIFEYDSSVGDDNYGTQTLSAPSNGGNNSGTWSGSVTFYNVNLASGGGDDVDDVLEIRARFTEFSPGTDYSYDSGIYSVNAVPSTPTSITVPSSDSDGTFTISWGSSQGYDNYELQEKVDSGSWNQIYYGGSTSYSVSGRAYGHTYYYRVRGVNSSSSSSWRDGGNGCNVPKANTSFNSCSVSPNPADLENTLTLSAKGLNYTGGSGLGNVTVKFYIDGTYKGQATTSDSLGSRGDAAITVSAVSVGSGSRTLKVVFEGNTTYNSCEKSSSFTVNPKKTTSFSSCAASPNPADLENTLTLEAKALNYTGGSGLGGVTVKFYIDNVFKGSATTSGTLGSRGDASMTISAVSVGSGSHTLKVVCDGDSYYSSCEKSSSFTVNPKKTTSFSSCAASPNPADLENTLTLSAKALNYTGGSGLGGVTVIFYIDNVLKGQATTSGTLGSRGDASMSVSALSVGSGSHTLKVVYDGDSYYTSCEKSSSFTVNPKKTTSFSSCAASPNPADLENTLTLEAKALNYTGGSGLGGMTVKFYIDNVLKGQATTSGTLGSRGDASMSVSALSVGSGSHILKVVYEGDAYYNSCEKTASFTVNPKKSTSFSSCAASPNPADLENTLTLSAKALNYTGGSGLGNATVKFYIDNVLKGQVTTSGTLGSRGDASMTISAVSVGSGAHVLKVVYEGDSYYNSCEKTAPFTVNPKKSSSFSSCAASPNPADLENTLTLSAKALNYTGGSGLGNATVKFYIDNVLKGQATTSGTLGSRGDASMTISAVSVGSGSHVLKVVYEGDSYYNSCEKTGPFTVNPKKATSFSSCSAIPNPSDPENTLLLSAKALNYTGGSGLGNMPVTFYIDNVLKGQGITSGTLGSRGDATITVSSAGISSGSHTLKVSYDGDAYYNNCEKTNSFAILKGTLNINIKNAGGASVQNAYAIRYPSVWGNSIDTRTSDADGVVKWENVNSGKYNFEFYSKSDVATREYWGYEDTWAVPTGSTSTMTFTRREPYALGFKVFDGNTEVTGGSVRQGKLLKLQVEVQNMSQVQRNVGVVISLDQNQDATADYTLSLSPQIVGANSKKTFETFCTPNQAAILYRKLQVNTSVNGNWVKTDSWPFGGPAVTISPPPAPKITGISTEMQPGKRYVVTAEYNSMSDLWALNQLWLGIENPNDPNNPISLIASKSLGGTWYLQWASTNYVVGYPGECTVEPIANGCRASFTFSLYGKWAEVPTGLKFGTYSTDWGGNKSDWLWTNTSCRFVVPSLPLGKWTVFTHGRTTSFGGQTYSEMRADGKYLMSMARAIERIHKPGTVAIHSMTASTFAVTNSDGISLNDTTKHHIVLFDWTGVADYIGDGRLDALSRVKCKNAAPPDWSSQNGYSYASADALYAFIAKHQGLQKIHTLIGHSRGGVVMSEVTRRLLERGTSLRQTVFLDPEGEGGFFASYTDKEFKAWRGIRTDNYYNSADGPFWSVGGHRVTNANNAGPVSDRDDGHGLVQTYFEENMYVEKGGVWGGGTDNILLTPVISTNCNVGELWPNEGPLIDSPYHGEFFFKSDAGWQFHGGGGLAPTRENNEETRYGVRMSATKPGRIHNYSLVPTGQVTGVSMGYIHANGQSLSGASLRLKWAGITIGAVNAGSGTFWEREFIPYNFAPGSVDRLEIEGINLPANAEVLMDEVAFDINSAPSIGSLVPTPDSVVEGGLVNLAAINVRDNDISGTVQLVEFWHVLAGGGEERLNINTVGAPPGGDWYANIRTSSFEHRQHTFKARAKDNKGSWSPWVTCILTVNAPANSPPKIGSFNVTPLSVNSGLNFTMTASNVTDPGGSVSRVTFYQDNGDGVFSGSDIDLGNGTTSGTAYTQQVSTTGYPVGNVRFWAVAYDNMDVPSAPTSRVVTVKQLWTLAYSVKPSADAGSISRNPVAGTYPHGTTVNPTATANSGWYLHHWETNNEPVSLPFALSANTTVAGVFSQIVVQAQAPVIEEIPDHTTPAGSPYSCLPTLSQGYPAPTWSLVSTHPAGMSIDPVSGKVSWPSPQSVGQSFVITIRASNSQGVDDKVWSLTVISGGQVEQPQFSPDDGEYAEDLKVKITCSTVKAVIRYTIDGSTPTENTGVIIANGANVPISQPTLLKARAFKTNWIESLVKEAAYTFIEPRVKINSPTNGATFYAPSSIAIKAIASDADGIQMVKFLEGTNCLGSTNGSPYSFTWMGATSGVYELRACAIDNLGNAATSIPVKVEVKPNPGVIQFTTASVSVAEGVKYAKILVSRAGGSYGPVSVNYKTLNNSAYSGQDYVARSGTLTWGDGVTGNKNIKVTIIDDQITEPTEAFKIQLSNATGATLGYPRVVKVTILANTKGPGGQVQAGVRSIPISSAVENDVLKWETKRAAPWSGQAIISADGVDAAMSGTGSTNGVSWLETSVTGPGTLGFDWRLITANPGDTLLVLDNGAVLSKIAGLTDWANLSIPLKKGTHTLRWVFLGDLLGTSAQGAGYLDRVKWTAD
jgi:pimeloyl-ACP methyl ester carboxylesterase